MIASSQLEAEISGRSCNNLFDLVAVECVLLGNLGT